LRILDVFPRVAYPPHQGSAVRVYNLLHELSQRHECVGFSHVRSGARFSRPSLDEVGHGPSYLEVRFTHPLAGVVREVSERAWVRAPVLAGEAFRLARPGRLRELLAWAEVVLVEFPWQFEHCRRQRPDASLVYASHNLEAQKFTSYAEVTRPRLTRRPWLSYIRRLEANAARRAMLVLAVSPEDRQGFVDLYRLEPAKVVEIPNGADTRHYKPAGPEERAAAKRELGLPDGPVVVFAGSTAPPNRTALAWLERLAARETRFTYVVVGPVAEPRRTRRLVCAGRVPDLAPYLTAADLAIVPIAHLAGTKIKLFESLAAGLPTVAFSEALHGTAFRDGEHLLVAEKSVESLEACLERLASDRELTGRLGSAGRKLVLARYDWRSSASKLEEALSPLVADRPQARTR
jgi:glycosyltransferase involved in cell wall biosynthesis